MRGEEKRRCQNRTTNQMKVHNSIWKKKRKKNNNSKTKCSYCLKLQNIARNIYVPLLNMISISFEIMVFLLLI